jgi:hypothetical protein
MTLTEYFNQKDSVRMPDVVLAEGEYTKGATVQITGHESLTQIFINAFGGSEYVKKSGSGKLYTTDKHGNPKSQSCFRIV